MTIYTDDQLQALQRIGRIVATTLKIMQDAVRPGISTEELNEVGARYLYKQGATPAPISDYQFPAETCISINEEAAHGIPGRRIVRPGDLVNIDVSAELGGIYADTGGTIAVPTVSREAERLVQHTRTALDAACDAVTAGKPLWVIGEAIQKIARKGGYNIIRELGGHGVGYSLHEDPRNVPNFFTRSARQQLTNGMVLTIEPFLTRGSGHIYEGYDGWTLRTTQHTLACQFEHTVVITKGKPILVTAL
jgi:methionyl aminopeptidase